MERIKIHRFHKSSVKQQSTSHKSRCKIHVTGEKVREIQHLRVFSTLEYEEFPWLSVGHQTTSISFIAVCHVGNLNVLDGPILLKHSYH